MGMIASFGLGALSVLGLHAQAAPPAYVVTVFDTGTDMANADYPSLAPATFQPYGGHYTVHSGKTVRFDGDAPERIIVIAFANMEKALAWHASDAFKQSYNAHKIGRIRAFAVEGSSQ